MLQTVGLILKFLIQIAPLFAGWVQSRRETERLKQQIENEVLKEEVKSYGRAMSEDIVPYDGNRDGLIEWVRSRQ